MKELHLGPHVDCDRRGSLRTMSGDGLDTIGREFGEQGGVPDRIKSTRYVQVDGSDLMSDIEDLHLLLGKQEQQVQGRVTQFESRVTQVIRNQAIGEEEGIHV